MYHQEPYLDLLQVWIEGMFVKLVALKEKAYWWCIALQLSFRSNQVGKISKAEHDFIMIQSKHSRRLQACLSFNVNLEPKLRDSLS